MQIITEARPVKPLSHIHRSDISTLCQAHHEEIDEMIDPILLFAEPLCRESMR